MNRSEEKKLRRIISEAARDAFSAKKSSSRLRLFEDDEKDEAKTSAKLDVSKGPSAAIAFLNGPGADKRVRALLNAGQRDGIPEDEKAKVTETSKTLGDLQPTQIEIELTKSIAFPLSKFDSLKKMISGGVQRVGPKGNDMIVTSGNLIIDGHHRWSSLFSVGGPDAQIAAIDVVLPEKDAPSVLAIVQTAIASTLTSGEPVPKAKAGGMNILGKGKDELVKMITSAWKSGGGEAGAILTDDFVKQCLDDPQVSKHFGLNTTAPGGTAKKEPESDQKAESRSRAGSLLEKSSKFGTKMDKRITIARSTIINKVADNLSKMAAPAEGSPPRVDMPQLDQAAGGVQGALANLQKGKVNYKTPFKIVDKGGGEREINVPAESSAKSGDVILERWQKIAGLIK